MASRPGGNGFGHPDCNLKSLGTLWLTALQQPLAASQSWLSLPAGETRTHWEWMGHNLGRQHPNKLGGRDRGSYGL